MNKEDFKNYTIKAADAIVENKGKDVLIIDVEEVTPFFDFLLIATADSFPHLNALAKFVEKKMDEVKVKKVNPVISFPENPWVLIDYGFLIVHVFNQEARSFYNLENLWADGVVIYDSSKIDEKASLYT